MKGDGDLVDKHRDFYDEYLAVMDLSAEYYLQTVDTVFVKHALPKGEMTHRGKPVDPSKITRVALMTVEGENDDISGLGQTEATHALCSSIPQSSPGALRAEGRRTLRRVQRFALQIGNRAAHLRFHDVGGELKPTLVAVKSSSSGGGISVDRTILARIRSFEAEMACRIRLAVNPLNRPAETPIHGPRRNEF